MPLITDARRRLVSASLFLVLGAVPASAEGWFDLRRFEEFKETDRTNLEFVLEAMYESVFYAQESIGKPVICATPAPIAGAKLIEMVDTEIAAPTHPTHPEYTDSDHVAFVLMNALKAEKACR